MLDKIKYSLLFFVLSYSFYGDDVNLPYPRITDQYSFLVDSYFSSENTQYPILYLSGNIGSFLVLAKPLQSTVKPPEDQFDSNPNVNYTITYYREQETGKTQPVVSDMAREEDNNLKNLPLINSK